MWHKKIGLGIALLAMITLNGQENSIITQFKQNYYLINPAYAGFTGDTQIHFITKPTYTVFPQFNFNNIGAGFHVPLDSNRSGWGGRVFYEEYYGFRKNFGLYGSYAFSVYIGENTFLRMGGSLGVVRRADSINIPGQIYGTEIKYYPTLDFGMFLTSGNFQVGASAVNINRPTIKYAQGPRTTERLLYLVASYDIEANKYLLFTPAVQLRNVNNQNAVDLDARLYMKTLERLIVGAGMRFTNLGRKQYTYPTGTLIKNINFLVVMAGIYITKDAYFGISYDYPANSGYYFTNSLLEGSLIINL